MVGVSRQEQVWGCPGTRGSAGTLSGILWLPQAVSLLLKLPTNPLLWDLDCMNTGESCPGLVPFPEISQGSASRGATTCR